MCAAVAYVLARLCLGTLVGSNCMLYQSPLMICYYLDEKRILVISDVIVQSTVV